MRSRRNAAARTEKAVAALPEQGIAGPTNLCLSQRRLLRGFTQGRRCPVGQRLLPLAARQSVIWSWLDTLAACADDDCSP
jgi:hypothetical protein